MRTARRYSARTRWRATIPADPGPSPSQGLVAFVPAIRDGAALYDPVGNLTLSLIGGASWGLGRDGDVLSCQAAGAGAAGPIPAGSAALIQPPFTLAVGFTWDGGSPDLGAVLWGTAAAAAGTTAFRLMASTTGAIGAYNAAGKLMDIFTPTAGMSAVVFWSATPSGGTAAAFQEGALVAQMPLGAPGTATYSGAQLSLGAPSGLAARNAHALLSWGSLHNRALFVEEMEAIAANPWGLLPYWAGPPTAQPAVAVATRLRRSLYGRAGGRGMN